MYQNEDKQLYLKSIFNCMHCSFFYISRINIIVTYIVYDVYPRNTLSATNMRSAEDSEA